MDNLEIHLKSISPPKALVDCSPLQSSMERNRESLKIKLMVRRSANQLVEQGILPPLKTSPAIHEQKKLLERAKTGDLLKAKIQQRPDRQELERRHILESHEGHIDPSLADKYRMLEKAILVDQLNSKISHRPGPLELIEKNILHANEPIERIVKEGLVPFKASSDNLYIEDDSQSSEGDISTLGDNALLKNSINIKNDQQIILNSNNNIEQLTPPLNVINLNLPLHSSVIAQSALVPKLTLQIPTTSIEHQTITLPCLVTTESLIPVAPTTQIEQKNEGLALNDTVLLELPKESKTNIDGSIKHHISSFLQNNQKFSCGGKEKIKKKCKIKPTAKIKAIKFHEYKGPPNAQKMSTQTTVISSASSVSSGNHNKKIGETNYELIMQQQCLLEYLEGIYKNQNKTDNEILHQEKQQTATHDKLNEKFQDDTRIEDVKKPFITIFPSKSKSPSINAIVEKDSLITDASKLGKMKVSELKSYLKKLNLPVSGPKPLLIERLKPYLPFKPSDITRNFEKHDVVISPHQEAKDSLSQILPSSVIDSTDSQLAFKDDHIVKEQQRQIEELQRKLLESQSELEQIKLSKVSESNDSSLNNNDQFFQILPDSNNIQAATASVLYDSKYQLPNKVSTVFVVGVTPLNSINSADTIPMIVQEEQIETPDNNSDSRNNNNTANNHIIDQNLVLSSATNQVEVELNKDKSNTLYNNAIVQDDINDVLEILLKNEKWNGGKNDVAENKILVDSNVSFSDSCHGSIKFEKEILEGTLVQNDELLSSQIDETLDKNESLLSFPMEVEDNSNSSFNNIDPMSYFKKDSHNDSLECNGFDNFCNNIMKNNNNFEKNIDNNCYNGIKNSLIGNFDNGMFDTFRTGVVNSTSNNSPVLNDIDNKETKYIFNNINNFDVFGNNTAVELPTTTPMDFENIISYDIFETGNDPFFSINSFQNISERENFINSHVNNSSNAMLFCEDTNMLETGGNDLKW